MKSKGEERKEMKNILEKASKICLNINTLDLMISNKLK